MCTEQEVRTKMRNCQNKGTQNMHLFKMRTQNA